MKRPLKFAVIPVLILAVVAILGYAVMILWNVVTPALFSGARPIDFFHAVGLLVLCRILFGGFRGRGGWGHRRRWNRCSAMTPAEREQLSRHRT
jgi:hypothetical protein